MAEVSHLPASTEVEDFAFHHSSPHSLRKSFSSPPAPPLIDHVDTGFDSDYCSSYNGANEIIDDALADDETFSGEEEGRRVSGLSAVSSFPGSVIQLPPEDPKTPTRPSHLQGFRNGSTGSLGDHNDVRPGLGRSFGSGFRNPGSVKAMQMRDDDTESIIPHHRRSGSRISTRSHGSAHSTSPSKRQSRSNQTSPLKGSKLKKEFPLVLLHCTLLAPASSTMPINCDNELYAALLPEEYQKRWNNLQDRLSDPETKMRGVLISHPQEDYELLEERLLESLELENPRIRGSHFFQTKSDGDSGFESASQTEEESGDENKDARCPDCGKCLHLKLEGDRKWEIKVYAANGLMRAGAWSAAWREMEKVDIEISLAMPEDIRREVNARLDALRAAQEDADTSADQSPPAMDPRQQEIYGSRPTSSVEPQHAYTDTPPKANSTSTALPVKQSVQPMDVLRDRKNIIIVLLSILVLFYAMTGAAKELMSSQQSIRAASSTIEVQTSTVTSTSVFTTTMETALPSVLGTPSPDAVEIQDSNTSASPSDEVASESNAAEGDDQEPIQDAGGLFSEDEVLELLADE